MGNEYGPLNLRELLGEKRYLAELAEVETVAQQLEIAFSLPDEIVRSFVMDHPTLRQTAGHSDAEVFLARLYNCGARTVRQQSDGTDDD